MPCPCWIEVEGKLHLSSITAPQGKPNLDMIVVWACVETQAGVVMGGLMDWFSAEEKDRLFMTQQYSSKT